MDEDVTIEEGFARVAEAIVQAAHLLGNGGAATPMGALEAHGLCIKEAADRIGSAIVDLADAVREHKEA